MTGLWICKDKRRLYRQANFAAASETEDNIPKVALYRLDGTHFWADRDTLEPVTFEMVERAFLDLKITF